MTKRPRAQPFPDLPRPILFAHRGASLQAPENTLEAFEWAVRLGAKVLEMDVRLTADGRVVVLHDAEVDRTTDGAGRVAELTYAQLRTFDAGARFASASGQSPFRGRQVKVPLFEEVLAAFRTVPFNVELKTDDPALLSQVLAILARAKRSDLVLTAHSDVAMARLEMSDYEGPLGLCAKQCFEAIVRARLGRKPHRFERRALQIPIRYWGVPLLNARAIDVLRACDIPVHYWVVNDAAVAERLVAAGADGVMTDSPALFASSAVFSPTKGRGAASGPSGSG